MESTRERYQNLKPLTVDQEVFITLAALKFFQGSCYRENCRKIGKTPTPNVIEPMNRGDFFKFLTVEGEIPPQISITEPYKHLQRINELINKLSRAGILSHVGTSGAPNLGDSYFTFYEVTNLEAHGVLRFAKALGPRFLPWAYQPGTYQITGETSDGQHHAGTGIAISPRWLLTCAHVINDMTVHSNQTTSYHGFDFNVISLNPHDKIDVGLIEVDRDLPQVQGLSFRTPYIGEQVYTFGFPRIPLSQEAVLVLQGGEVSVEKMTSYFGQELFLFSAIARPGNSGGPIISADGHVVGIVTQELAHQDSTDQPFHAGIATDVLEAAISELNLGVNIPIETWE